MDVETVDLGDEVRHGVEARLDFTPVVLRAPVAREFLDGGERDALREVGDRLTLGQPRGIHAPAQLVEFRFGDADLELTKGDCVVAGLLCDGTHPRTPFRRTEKTPYQGLEAATD